MELRELIETEKSELEKIIVSEYDNGYKVLLAMIAIDLMESNAYERKLKYEDFIEYIDNETYNKGDVFVLMPIIETWIIKMALNNKIAIDEKVKKNIYCLVICFINSVCQISAGMYNKKCKDMVNWYKEIDEKIPKQDGDHIYNYPEINYRYIVSCLEYMGFKRIPKDFDGVVDMNGIYYSDILE